MAKAEKTVWRIKGGRRKRKEINKGGGREGEREEASYWRALKS